MIYYIRVQVIPQAMTMTLQPQFLVFFPIFQLSKPITTNTVSINLNRYLQYLQKYHQTMPTKNILYDHLLSNLSHYANKALNKISKRHLTVESRKKTLLKRKSRGFDFFQTYFNSSGNICIALPNDS